MSTSTSLGIYFGPKSINLVEVKGKQVINSIQLQRSLLYSAELEERVPDEVKMVALFKEELRKSKVEARETSICISSKDLIIRTFEMPVLPSSELAAALSFEVKKYIPFKIEDLVSAFQSKFDKASRKNDILYAAIKKETLDKYLSIAQQLNLKVNAIEYNAFSVLRFMKLANVPEKGVVGVLSADSSEVEEINFSILENGFPLFSRDISLVGRPEEFAKPQEMSMDMIQEKLKTEVRISLDYYNRKFSAKKVSKIIFLCNDDLRLGLESFLKEMGHQALFIDSSKYIGIRQPFSLGFIKAYGAALSPVLKTNLKVNIVESGLKQKAVAAKAETGMPETEISAFFSGIAIDFRLVALGIFICLAVFGYGIYKVAPFKKDLEVISAERPKLPDINTEANFETLSETAVSYVQKIEALNSLVTKQLYMTDILDAIPRLVPDDIRLTAFSFSKKDAYKAELAIQGVCYSGDNDREFTTVTSFVAAMKNNEKLKKYFRNISLTGIEHNAVGKVTATSFTIFCSSN